jgi:hypothetical protein
MQDAHYELLGMNAAGTFLNIPALLQEGNSSADEKWTILNGFLMRISPIPRISGFIPMFPSAPSLSSVVISEVGLGCDLK